MFGDGAALILGDSTLDNERENQAWDFKDEWKFKHSIDGESLTNNQFLRDTARKKESSDSPTDLRACTVLTSSRPHYSLSRATCLTTDDDDLPSKKKTGAPATSTAPCKRFFLKYP